MKLFLVLLESRMTPVVGFSSDAIIVQRTGSDAFYNGVVKIGVSEFDPTATGSGSLFYRGVGQGYGHQILTAAHATGKDVRKVTFELERGGFPIDISINVPGGNPYQIQHPDYKGLDHDVGILKLTDQVEQGAERLLVAPYKAQQYQLLPTDVVSQTPVYLVGYGATGKGAAGERNGSQGTKRQAKNDIDVITSPTQFYDFDDSTAGGNTLAFSGSSTGYGDHEEGMTAGGDSGSPLFSNYQIVGVVYGSSPPSAFGTVGTATTTPVAIDKLVKPYVDEAGAYDLVLDMEQQIYGRSGYASPVGGGVTVGLPESITITVSNVNGNLQIVVDGPELSLNGLYYSAPSGNIKSLTIRGSNDHETIVLDGPLGLAGDRKVTIQGRDGDDIVRIVGLDRPGTPDAYGDITVNGGGGENKLYVDDTRSSTDNIYNITNNSLTRVGRNPVNFSSVNLLGLQTGTGKNLVNQNGLPGNIKLEVAAGPTEHDKFAQLAGHSNDPLLTGFEKLDITGGTLTLIGANGLAVRDMTQSGGVLAGSATVSASETLVWSGGTMQDAGWTIAEWASTVTIGGGVLNGSRTLWNDGTGSWKSDIAGDHTGTIHNAGTLATAARQVILAGTLENSGTLQPGGAGLGRVKVSRHFDHSGNLEVQLGPGENSSDQVDARTAALGGWLSPATVTGFPAKFYNVVLASRGGTGQFGSHPDQWVGPIDDKRYKMLYEADPADWNKAVLRAVATIGGVAFNDRLLDGIRGDNNPYEDYLVYAGVELYLASDHTLIASTDTSPDSYAYGEYRFPDVLVDSYYIKFTLDPDAHAFTLKDVGSDTLDSDADQATGKTAVFTLTAGVDQLTWDAGMYWPVDLGGDLFWDPDGDGVPNHVANMAPYVPIIRLYDAAGNLVSDQPERWNDDDSAYYMFRRVPPGIYRVQFVLTPAGGEEPLGALTIQHAHPDSPFTGSDSDPDPLTGFTQFVILDESQERDWSIWAGLNPIYSEGYAGRLTAAESPAAPAANTFGKAGPRMSLAADWWSAGSVKNDGVPAWLRFRPVWVG